MEGEGKIREYIWTKYQKKVTDMERKMCGCTPNCEKWGGKERLYRLYPGCIYLNGGPIYGEAYWDCIFASIKKEYPAIYMEAYLLS